MTKLLAESETDYERGCASAREDLGSRARADVVYLLARMAHELDAGSEFLCGYHDEVQRQLSAGSVHRVSNVVQ